MLRSFVFDKGHFSEFPNNFLSDQGVSFRLSAYIRKKRNPQSLKFSHSVLDALQAQMLLRKLKVCVKYLISFLMHDVNSSSAIKWFPRNCMLTFSYVRNQCSLCCHKPVLSYNKQGRTLYRKHSNQHSTAFLIQDGSERKFSVTSFQTKSFHHTGKDQVQKIKSNENSNGKTTTATTKKHMHLVEYNCL